MPQTTHLSAERHFMKTFNRSEEARLFSMWATSTSTSRTNQDLSLYSQILARFAETATTYFGRLHWMELWSLATLRRKPRAQHAKFSTRRYASHVLGTLRCSSAGDGSSHLQVLLSHGRWKTSEGFETNLEATLITLGLFGHNYQNSRQRLLNLMQLGEDGR